MWRSAFSGSRGVAESHYSGVVGIYGDEPWSWDGGGTPVSPSTNIYALGEETAAEQAAGTFHGALDEADPEKTKAFVDSILTRQVPQPGGARRGIHH